MELYAPDAELEIAKKQLRLASGAEKAAVLISLAWYTRQRDSLRSGQYADEAEALIVDLELSDQAMRAHLARIDLARAEIAALFGEFTEAEAHLAMSRSRLHGFEEFAIQGDSDITEAMISLERGQTDREIGAYKAAITAYGLAQDPVRTAIAEGWMISRLALNDPEEASRRADELERNVGAGTSPALTCLLAVVRFRLAYSSDPAQAVLISVTISDAARSAGMLRQELVYRFNAGWSLIELGDFEGAAPWIEEALQRARDAGWPMQIGLGLISLGTLMRKLGDPLRARALLEEALVVIPAEGSTNQAATYWELGDVLLDLALYGEAVAALEQSVQRYRTALMMDNLSAVLISYARAVSFQGDAERALATLEEARGVIERYSYSTRKVDLYRALADIYGRHRHVGPGRGAPSDAVVDCLEHALHAGQALAGWKPEVALLTSLRDAWAAAGDLARALEYSNLALERERQHARETAAGRVALVQQRHELERVRAEAQYHRQLAATAGETSHTLDQLGRIGQEITAGLNTEHVFSALYRNLGNLLDAPTLSVFLLEDSATLTLRFGMDEGVKLPLRVIPLDSPTSKAARCIRERSEVLMEGLAAETTPSETHIPGTQVMRTALFGPLIAGDRVLGALSIQSPREKAYGERERLIFRTLCAYGAIALDNAAAYRQLQAAQERIVLQEKMAGLGTLTAGVAHEINNPANFAHAGVQLLGEDIARLRAFLLALAGDDADAEILYEIGHRFDALSGHVGTIREGTTRIRDLVKDLRTFSRINESERKSVRLSESLESTLNLVRTHYADVVDFSLEMRADPVVDCWPALLNQVFMNLIVNACQAIKAKLETGSERAPGLLRISSRVEGDMMTLSFEDNGIGMAPATLKRVFEPFFTTKDVGEGTGLGMSISFGIVEKHNGTIEASSTEGKGTRFVLRLPLQERSIAA